MFRKTLRGGGAEPKIDFKQDEQKTPEQAFEASGLAITKEDVKQAQGELGIRTSAKTKERVAQMHNRYANEILSACTDAPTEFKALAMQYAQELPKASRGRDIQDYKAACEAKLDAFRAAADRMGMGQYLVKMNQDAQNRHVET